MKKKASISITVLLLLVLAVSVVMAARTSLDHRKGAADYEEALSLASGEAVQASTPAAPAEDDLPSEAATLLALDLDALRQVNGEVLGWLSIPGAGISYPLMEGRDNSYYLNHTWKGEASSVGAIFLDIRNRQNFQDFNTIIYGHRMRNQSMFGKLAQYREGDFWKSAPSVFLVDDRGAYRYDIFAAYRVSVTAVTYQWDISDMAQREAFLAFALGESDIDTGVTPTAEDQILTLSTCTGRSKNERWVVQAVLAETYPR